MKLGKLTKWILMAALLANVGAAGVLRETGNLTEAGNSLGEWILALWIFFFGVAYLWFAFSRAR